MKDYFYLMRLDKPVGIFLLFWPCTWGMAYNLNFHFLDKEWFLYFVLFFFGSILMRSAGCIYNDIVDVNIDKKVQRTKNRPLASGKISINNAWILIFILCLISLVILFQFNIKTIICGFASILIVLFYPFAKRFTYWPQLILGIVFNFGVLLSWLSLNTHFTFGIIYLYISGILWTLGYDTIYALQDIDDDKKIGVKSSAIYLKDKIYIFLYFTYTVQILFILLSAFQINGFNSLLLIFVLPYLWMLFHIHKMKLKKNYLKVFQFNNYFGLLILLSLLSLPIYS